ncbi:MAG: D-glycero-beta-D-manno-heptose 1-phosphate adenylyltransferase [Bacteroidota bacterium]|jgi:rfaE bifunctional protein nucleotidyltransferase chain/domain
MKVIQYLERKILDEHSLLQWKERWKLASKKIVFTNGVFDLLHAGHIHTLKHAASFGNILIVGVNSDASVKRLKGEARPVQCTEDRIEILSSLEMIDAVIVFEEDTPLELIKKIIPDVLVKGGDYSIETIVGANEVMAAGGKVEIIPLIPGKSSTNLIDKITGL